MTRRTAVVAALLACASLAGCGGAAAASSTTATVPVQYVPTTTTVAPVVRAAPLPPEPPCTTAETKIETVLPTAQEGDVYLEVVVGVVGARRCSLDGYPSVRLYGRVGGRDVALGVVASHEKDSGVAPLGSAPALLDIGPQSGDTSAFFVQMPDSAGAKGCRVVDGLGFATPGAARLSPEVGLAEVAGGPAQDTGTVSVCGAAVLVSPFEVPMIPDVSG
jgi:hypothetical protein